MIRPVSRPRAARAERGRQPLTLDAARLDVGAPAAVERETLANRRRELVLVAPRGQIVGLGSDEHGGVEAISGTRARRRARRARWRRARPVSTHERLGESHGFLAVAQLRVLAGCEQPGELQAQALARGLELERRAQVTDLLPRAGPSGAPCRRSGRGSSRTGDRWRARARTRQRRAPARRAPAAACWRGGDSADRDSSRSRVPRRRSRPRGRRGGRAPPRARPTARPAASARAPRSSCATASSSRPAAIRAWASA